LDARRNQIGALLRGARSRIDPAELGLSTAGRRKAPGLRREDVAVLAEVSVKWYTWLEQGRALNFSEEVLCRISRVLRLSACEQAYLLALTQRRKPAEPSDAPVPTEWLRRTVQFFPSPVLAMTLRWDILAWNDLTTRIFRDYGAVPAGERNLLRVFLTDRRYQRDSAAYEQVARRMIAEFRLDFARCAGDPAFDALIAELHGSAPGFERLWNTVDLGHSPRGTVVQDEQLGELYFDRISYVPEHQPSTRVLMFVPGEPNTARIVASLQPSIDEACPPWTANAISDSYLLRSLPRH
jgi:transcriptional regulator with XRE-family HTH domain